MNAKQLIEDLIFELIETDKILHQRCETLAALQTVLAKHGNETNARIDTMNDNIHILIARVSALEAANAAPADNDNPGLITTVNVKAGLPPENMLCLLLMDTHPNEPAPYWRVGKREADRVYYADSCWRSVEAVLAYGLLDGLK